MTTPHWSDDIPVDEDALVDPQEVVAIKRTVAHFAAAAREYARKHDTSETLRTIKAALAMVRDVFTLQSNEAEALQEQVNRAVRGRTALPAAQQPNSSQQLQPYTGGQPPAVAQGANAALERALLGLLSRLGVPVYIPNNGQLDSQMLNSLIQDAHGKVRELEERANQADDLQQQLDNRQQQPQGSPWAPLNPAPVSPQSDPPTDGFILRDTLAAILRNLDEDLEIGQGGASTPSVKHPSGRLGLGSSVSPEDQETRENAFQGAWDKIRELAGLTGRRTRRGHRS